MWALVASREKISNPQHNVTSFYFFKVELFFCSLSIEREYRVRHLLVCFSVKDHRPPFHRSHLFRHFPIAAVECQNMPLQIKNQKFQSHINHIT